ncbi:MAG: hypothetical protein NXI00_10895 [Cytophagales bacterium]|nr:hypothetical protein [Cytophagales bacterium]
MAGTDVNIAPNKLTAYREYFKGIATKYRPIGHTEEKPRFETYSRAAVMAGRRQNGGLDMTKFCMILLDPDPSTSKNNSRHFKTHIEGAFEIVKFNERNDVSKYDIQSEAFDMCEEIVAHMLTEEHEDGFPLGHLEEGHFDYYVVDEAFDKAVGYGVAFTFQVGFSRVAVKQNDNWL